MGEPIAVVLAETLAQGEDAAETVWAEIDPLPTYTDPEQALPAGPRRCSPGTGRTGDGDRRQAPHRPVDRRSRRARPLRQPAHRGGADRARLVRRRVDTTAGSPLALESVPALPQRPDRRRLGWSPPTSMSSPPRSAAASVARPASSRIHGSPRPLDNRSARGVGADPQRGHEGDPPQPRSDPVRRTGCTRDGTSPGLKGAAGRRRRRLSQDRAALPSGTRRMSQGTYEFPAIEFDVAVAVTNTTPTGAYRGAGRPGGDRAAGTARRPGRARARHRPDRDAASEPARR